MSIYVAPRKAAPVVKAGPIGPGSGVLQTEFPLAQYGIGKTSPQRKMQKAWTLSFEVPWIAAAEDAITQRVAGVDWHLEDENDTTIDDAYPKRDAQSARLLLEKPAAQLPVGAQFYRSDLWALTARAMGICGSGIIFLDQPESLAGTPAAMLPIAPWRLTEKEDANGNLIGWWIDKAPDRPGIEVSLEQILHYKLRPNFGGHFGVGLVESALRKAQITTGLDDHVGMVLSAGGRLSGILSPSNPNGIIGNEEVLQMERDWRTIVEQSEAAKRLQLVRAPIKFDRTTLTPAELQVRDLMTGSRDDLLTLWGVPFSIIGGTTPAGLNSGDTRKYDEAAIWQGPIHHRLNVFREVTQFQLLDRWQALGATVELEIEEPEFDDDSPRYDLLGKSLNTPMTNEERRALIGLPPLGDEALDRAIILPATIVPYALAPTEPGETATTVILGRAPQQISSGATLAAGETAKAVIRPNVAALRTSLVVLRGNLDRHAVPRLRSAVGEVLRAQRAEIASRLRASAGHLAVKPSDVQKWWDAAKWDRQMTAAIRPSTMTVATSVNAHVASLLPPQKAGPAGAVERVLTRGAARVGGINETTRAKIQEAIVRGLEQGLAVTDVADLIEGIGDADIGLDLPALFDEYRSELIARTELMDAYNASAIGSYGDAGITQVQAIDGDGDPECAERDGQVFDIDEADTIEDHPNGTLDWAPVIGQEEAA